MSSLSARLLVSVSVLLLFFFGATIVVLDTAFVSAGEQAREDILDGNLMQLLAAAEPNEEGVLTLPLELPEAGFNNIGSGLYAQLRGEANTVIWESQSALGLDLPVSEAGELGVRTFARDQLSDGTPLLTLTLAVEWVLDDDTITPYVFQVSESLDAFHAQVSRFRRQLFGWFAAVALIMLLAISVLMRNILKPLRQVESEIEEIEQGGRTSLSEDVPDELTGVARNMNLLIDSERARSERYRHTLDNLAHSLKTPLAAVRSLLSESRGDREFTDKVNEQVDRMDEIVRYQLRKPASSGDNLVLTPVDVETEVDKLAAGLQKVYREKQPDIKVSVDTGLQFRGDTGDFLELAGNLLDNACKWCCDQVQATVTKATDGPAFASGLVLTVEDDGPGIPEEAAEALLQRGIRLDEATPGHGIGLAIVKDIAESYGGTLTIGRSDLGGAAITVRIPPLTESRETRS